MFITNIRYGERPALKLYIGEKLVWQCLTLESDTKSDLNLKEAVVYIPVVRAATSDVEATSYLNSPLNAIEVALMMSEEEAQSYNKAVLDVPQLLLLTGIVSSKVHTAFGGDAVIRIVTEGMSESTFNLFVIANAHDALLLESSVIEFNNEVASMDRAISMFVSGSVLDDSDDNVIGSIGISMYNESDTTSASDVDVQTVLWYPPLNGEEILFEGECEDITVSGDTLEIRQAYQVIINDENGTLEVI